MISLNDNEIEIKKFPDGALLMKEEVYKKRADILWQFENNEELVALIYLTRHLKDRGAEEVHLIMPYIPNARQDRVKSSEDVFTLKYFAEVINSLGFNSVKVFDPHSVVSEALINNINVLSPRNFIQRVVERIAYNEKYMNENGVIKLMMFYPDEGAMKRYSGMVNHPYVFGIKDRDWKTGEIKDLKIEGYTEGIKNSTVLIVDDICSRGGTFYHSALKLKELGAKHIILCVSHCENTILEGEVLTCGLIDKVYTTDSIFTKEHEKIEVL